MKRYFSVCPVMVYFVWYLFSVDALAARHLGEEITYHAAISFAGLLRLLIVLCKKFRDKMPPNGRLAVPLVYIAVGLVTLMIGYHTPCCTGG